MNIYEAIAERVTAKEAAALYGLKFRGGRAVCPWHNDHHPDLAFYDSHCFCHACHNGGDAVALTAQLFNVSMLDAAARLNKDFNLKLNLNTPTIPTGQTKAQLQQQEQQRINRNYGMLCEIERQADARLREMSENEKDWNSLWDNPRFVSALEARSRAAISLDNYQAKGGE